MSYTLEARKDLGKSSNEFFTLLVSKARVWQLQSGLDQSAFSISLHAKALTPTVSVSFWATWQSFTF